MPHAGEAVLHDHEGRHVLRFERVLFHPRERVWRALTEGKQLASWHPTQPEFEPFVGGTVRYVSNPGMEGQAMPDGEVTEYEPMSVLGHTWGEDQLRWELRPHEDGCLLVLTHTFSDRFKAARDAAGWDLCLDALSSVLDGVGRSIQPDADGFPPGWRELNRAYELRFAIPPEKATPPPKP